jgi:hypothetical protein
MLVLKNKKLALNEELISSVSVTSDDGAVVIALGSTAIALEAGDDADTVRKDYGLTSKNEDDEAAAKKEKHAETPAVHPPKK